MKKLTMIAVLMVASLSASAQGEIGSFSLKPMVGATLSTWTKADGSKAKIGLIAGFEGEYSATHYFGLTVGALYAMEGTKAEGTLTGFDNTTIKYNVDYINIPVLANFYVTKGLALKFGVQPAFKVRAKVSGSVKYNGQTAKDSESLEGVKGFDFSIPLGLSYEFSDFILDARYNLGLTKITDGLDCKNSVFMLTLGYRIQF